jgi:hypothetical protein
MAYKNTTLPEVLAEKTLDTPKLKALLNAIFDATITGNILEKTLNEIPSDKLLGVIGGVLKSALNTLPNAVLTAILEADLKVGTGGDAVTIKAALGEINTAIIEASKLEYEGSIEAEEMEWPNLDAVLNALICDQTPGSEEPSIREQIKQAILAEVSEIISDRNESSSEESESEPKESEPEPTEPAPEQEEPESETKEPEKEQKESESEQKESAPETEEPAPGPTEPAPKSKESAPKSKESESELSVLSEFSALDEDTLGGLLLATFMPLSTEINFWSVIEELPENPLNDILRNVLGEMPNDLPGEVLKAIAETMSRSSPQGAAPSPVSIRIADNATLDLSGARAVVGHPGSSITLGHGSKIIF